MPLPGTTKTSFSPKSTWASLLDLARKANPGIPYGVRIDYKAILAFSDTDKQWHVVAAEDEYQNWFSMPHSLTIDGVSPYTEVDLDIGGRCIFPYRSINIGDCFWRKNVQFMMTSMLGAESQMRLSVALNSNAAQRYYIGEHYTFADDEKVYVLNMG